MNPSLSQRARGAVTSATMAAANAQLTHPHPISLSVGEPSAVPPQVVRDAMAACIQEGRTRYGPPAGLPELRAAAAKDRERRTGMTWSPEEVLITPGGKAGLMDGLRCMLEPEDEVLLSAPYWPSFLDQVHWAGGRAVVVPPAPDLMPSPEVIESLITPRSRALIVNDPVNPTSRPWVASHLTAVADIAQRHDLWILCDEVYGELVLDGPRETLLQIAPEARSRTLIVESFSKRFAMSGLRLGAAYGPKPLIEAMTRLASASFTHASTASQHGGLAALEGGEDVEAWSKACRAEYRDKREVALAILKDTGLRVEAVPEAAFYLFPDARELIERRGLADDVALARALAEEAGLRVVPGSAFGAPGHLRLSYSGPMEELVVAGKRLAEFAHVPATS